MIKGSFEIRLLQATWPARSRSCPLTADFLEVNLRSHFSLIPLALLTALVLTGCVQAQYRTHPDLSLTTRDMKTILLLEPNIKISQVSAGGVREQINEWSKLGIENVTQAMINHFNGTPIAIKVLKLDGPGNNSDEIKEILALNDAVSWSIVTHTYNEQSLFPTKKSRFEYSLGSLEAFLKKSGADALLMIRGEDEIATTGKIALNALSVLGGGTGRLERTYMWASLAGKNGDILWFNIKVHGLGSDLRNRESAAGFVADTFDGFPGFGK